MSLKGCFVNLAANSCVSARCHPAFLHPPRSTAPPCPPQGTSKLLTANSGDARIVLVRGNSAIQLSEDHVPDNEAERTRIETYNPNPRLPLVRYVGGTWRVGGLLALSRAFGDAYLKGSDQFEGVSFYASDSYQSGFGEGVLAPLASIGGCLGGGRRVAPVGGLLLLAGCCWSALAGVGMAAGGAGQRGWSSLSQLFHLLPHHLNPHPLPAGLQV
jgi:hypothetical protein